MVHAYEPTQETEIRRWLFEARSGQSSLRGSILKKKKPSQKRTGGVAQLVLQDLVPQK
jgi:hypothetical protein